MSVFDQDISVSVVPSKPGVLTGEISRNWSVNHVPNGGYLMAIASHAMMKEMVGKPSSAIITANYISRCTPGKVDLSVEKFSESTQFDRFQVNLSQNDNERIRAFGTFAKNGQKNSEVRYEKKPPVLCAPADAVAIPSFNGDYSIFEHLDVRLDPSCAGWMAGKHVEKSEHKGWIKFRDERPFDLLSLLLIADSFPPPIFVSQGMVAWVPTLEYSVNVRAVPETTWLKAVFRTRFVTGELLEEDGELWDEKDNLIAVSRQIAQFKKIT